MRPEGFMLNALLLTALFAVWGCGDLVPDDEAESDESAAVEDTETAGAANPDSDGDDCSGRGCPGDGLEDGESTTGREPEPEPPATWPEPCQLADDQRPETYTIATLTEIINQLPRPVTVPCFIDALPRPLKISGSKSELSVQPAFGAQLPRVFVQLDQVIMTFALAGEGKHLVEFGELTSSQLSLKGELQFPINTVLAPSAAYDQILAEGGGTRCVGCHANETLVDPDLGIYESNALAPIGTGLLSFSRMLDLAEACDDPSEDDCLLLKAFFRDEQTEPLTFPAGMPTLF